MGKPRVLRVEKLRRERAEKCNICKTGNVYKVILTSDRGITRYYGGTLICEKCLLDRLNTPEQSAYIEENILHQSFENKKAKKREILIS